MKLSFSSNAFVQYSFLDTINLVAEIGYQGIEALADVPHLYADNISRDYLMAVKEAVEDSNIKISNINANTAVGYYNRNFWEPLFEPSLANPDRTLRKWRLDYTLKCVNIADFLSVDCVSVTSGKPVSGIFPEDSIILLKDSLNRLAEYCEKKSVRIGIEYEPGLLVENIDELTYILDEINSPYLGANLDFGHSYLVGEDPENVIEKLGSKLFHAHIEDIIGKKHYHRIPGSGDICFETIFGALERSGYDGYVSVELYTFQHDPIGAAKDSLSYLKDIPGIRL
ncbi:MAG: sugar phosphate isomerase/epimerase [Syntrophaceae bacterium]|nr:sugar phosphate isomerase/epimerase [Syntrophaceae bacterium]